jgi:rare lipoprotein A
MLRILGAAALAAAIAMPMPATAKTCLASYYGDGERLNRHTANGEVFRPGGMTAAHRSYRFNTRLRVCYAKRCVVVRVNDRGPASYTGRCIDLSRGAAGKLGMIRSGTAKVRIQVVR